MHDSTRSDTARSARRDAALHLAAKLLCALTFVLIVAGGLVTSTESGLSVPDWPLSYGQFFPPMVGGVRFEHTHRVIAGIVALWTVGIAIAIFLREKLAWMKRLALLGVLAVVLQAALGGLTVIYLLPTSISVGHACLGQLFFVLTAMMAFLTSKMWCDPKPTPVADLGAFRGMAAGTVATYCFQLVLGAVVRHTAGYAVAYHAIGAIAAIVLSSMLLGAVFARFAHIKFLKVSAIHLAAMTAVQVLLGVGSFYYTIYIQKAPQPRTAEVLFATAHQATGALLLATTFLILIYAHRNLTSDTP